MIALQSIGFYSSFIWMPTGFVDAGASTAGAGLALLVFQLVAPWAGFSPPAVYWRVIVAVLADAVLTIALAVQVRAGPPPRSIQWRPQPAV